LEKRVRGFGPLNPFKIINAFGDDFYSLMDGILAKKSNQFYTPVFYSPSPEYPAACWSETEIPPSGAAGSFIFKRRAF
jgi:hypothetical protein